MFHHYHHFQPKDRKDVNYFNPNVPNYEHVIAHAQQTAYNMTEFSSILEFPTSAQNGLGQKCGIIQLGGGIDINNVKQNLASQGLPTDQFTYEPISIDGAGFTPGLDPNSDAECELDLQNIVCMAPYCNVRVYFAPNTDAGFYNAIRQSGLIDKNPITSILRHLFSFLLEKHCGQKKRYLSLINCSEKSQILVEQYLQLREIMDQVMEVLEIMLISLHPLRLCGPAVELHY